MKVKIYRAPFRISFAGGGTDYPAYFSKYGGAVISSTINRYVYVAVNELHASSVEKYRISYSRIEHVQSIDAIEHPSVREILRHFQIDTTLNVSTFSDIPARSGLGGSSAFACALIRSCADLKGISLSPNEVARLAVEVEREKLREPGGYQDQYASAFGNLRHYRFDLENTEVSAPLLTLQEGKEFSKSLFLTAIPVVRNEKHFVSIPKSDFESDALVGLHRSAIEVEELLTLLQSTCNMEEKIEAVGITVANSHKNKTLFTDIPHETESIISAARLYGAVGSKICGSGGGGFVLSVVSPRNTKKFLDGMKKRGTFQIRLTETGVEPGNVTWL